MTEGFVKERADGHSAAACAPEQGTVYLLGRKHSWTCYRRQYAIRNSVLALIMALLWFFSTALYGIATRWMGNLGVVAGWPVFMSVIVIGAGLLGIMTGEWKDAGKAPVVLQLAGMLLLVLAVLAFAHAQQPLALPNHARANGSAASSSLLFHLSERLNVR